MTSVVVSVPPLVVTTAKAGVQSATGCQDADFRFPTDHVAPTSVFQGVWGFSAVTKQNP